MAENERVQLKREELVGNEVVLSDINPKTNTESVDDSVKGIKLSQTLEKIWNDINNKLSRIVNSVNGRTGVVVLTAEDVGLENVDNVSFDDIKKWVINRIKQEFANHRIQLFENLEQADQFALSHDESRDGTPFYSEHGRASENELRSCIGYFYYDIATEKLTYEYRIINTIGATDNSIVYNELVNGHDFRGGKIGVNIWEYEDALKLYQKESGDTATQATLEGSGLYIDKDVLLPKLLFFNDCYTGYNRLLAKEKPATNAIPVEIRVDDLGIHPGKTPYLGPNVTINKYDLIFCNFADLPEFYNEDGTLQDGILPALISKQPAIGQVTQAPTRDRPDRSYMIKFYTIRPETDFGLTYYHQGYTNVPEDEFGDDNINSAHGSILGVKPTTGFTDNVSPDNKVVNVSGLTVTGHHNTESAENDHVVNNREYSTVFPHGARPVYASMDKNKSGSLGGVSIVPDTSLCVIPGGYENGSEMKNLPIKRAGNVDDKTGNVNTTSNLGINLLKCRRIDENTGESYAVNLSGFKIVGPNDVVQVINPTNKTLESLTGSHHSGGIAINAGSFIGISDPPKDNPTKVSYYDTGKVEVRIDPSCGLHDAGDNRLGVYLCKDLGDTLLAQGGLWFTPEGSIGVNLGLGLAVSSRGRTGWEDNSNYPHLCVSIVDPKTSPPDIYNNLFDVAEQNNYLGGLRYIQNSGHHFSAIGIRVNNETAWTYEGEGLVKTVGPSRYGTRGLQITNENVLGVQLYEDVKPKNHNPLSIKDYTYQDILYMMNPAFNGLREEYVFNDPTVIPPSKPDAYTLYNYLGTYYRLNTKSKLEKVFVECSSISDIPQTPDPTKFYIIRDRSEIGSSITVKGYEEPTIIQTILMPDFTVTGQITNTDASKVQDVYAKYQTKGKYYINTSTNKMYSDAAHTIPVTPSEGSVYTDMTGESPYKLYRYQDGVFKLLTEKDLDSSYPATDIDTEWLDRADVNRSGKVDAIDTSAILAFVKRTEENKYTNDQNGWVKYVNDNGWKALIKVVRKDPTNNSFKDLLNVRKGNVLPGLNLEYNEFQGLCVPNNPDGTDGINMSKLSVNIVDPSMGVSGLDVARNGGLRFGADGVLAVRINNHNSYQSTNPNKRHTTENKGLKDIDYDILVNGTKGLHIYPGNILGIQVNGSKGDLEIDSNGNLVISENYNPNKETLTFYKDNTHKVSYNGKEAITIELGPGLAFE